MTYVRTMTHIYRDSRLNRPESDSLANYVLCLRVFSGWNRMLQPYIEIATALSDYGDD